MHIQNISSFNFASRKPKVINGRQIKVAPEKVGGERKISLTEDEVKNLNAAKTFLATNGVETMEESFEEIQQVKKLINPKLNEDAVELNGKIFIYHKKHPEKGYTSLNAYSVNIDARDYNDNLLYSYNEFVNGGYSTISIKRNIDNDDVELSQKGTYAGLKTYYVNNKEAKTRFAFDIGEDNNVEIDYTPNL